MTTESDIVNRALQAIGTQTTINAGELASPTSNEAIQANLILEPLRDSLLRMAPWDCATNFSNLTYITSVPGTPENTSAGTFLWQKGVPAPPWAYEYQYPVDCLRALFVIPQFQTGFSGGIPIATAVTGGATAFWQGPPQKFKVTIDQFYPVTAATVPFGGQNFNIGDIITCASGPTSSAPIGAPVQLQVTAVAFGGITAVSVINQVTGSAAPLGGSYFAVQTNPVAMGSVAGVGGNPSSGGPAGGVGPLFNLSFGSKISQRVILTNQEFATLCHIKQITDPNLMDPLFIDAWVKILAARLSFTLNGDKALSNQLISEANNYITEARKVDGNEGLTINDVTPDWIRARGIAFDNNYTAGGFSNFQWGSMFSSY